MLVLVKLPVLFDLFFYVFLEAGFCFGKVHVLKQLILLRLLSFDEHFVGAFSLTVYVL